MTRRTNAALAGIAYLSYIAVGIPSMILMGKATAGAGVAAKLASVAQHTAELRAAILLTMLAAFSAILLGVTLWALTRDEDPDLAMMGLACRVGEGVFGAIAVKDLLGLLWLATATGPGAPDAADVNTLGTLFFAGRSEGVAAILFGVGSLCFTWLLRRGRLIPAPLAWIGVVASVLWVAGYPLRLVDLLPGTARWFIWLPMAAFEVPVALWLIAKGVAPPARRPIALEAR